MENGKKTNKLDIAILFMYAVLAVLYAAIFITALIDNDPDRVVRAVRIIHSVGGVLVMGAVLLFCFIKKDEKGFYIPQSPYWMFAIIYMLLGTNLERLVVYGWIEPNLLRAVIYAFVTGIFGFMTVYGIVGVIRRKEVKQTQVNVWMILTVIALAAIIASFLTN